MIYFHGVTYDELAARMEAPIGTVMWTVMAPGVKVEVLFDDPLARRRSKLVHLVPGSTYAAHHHDKGHEECLVLEGELAFGELRLFAGDVHIASPSPVHPTAVTKAVTKAAPSCLSRR